QLQSSDVKARSQALFQLQPDSVTNPTQAIELLVEVLTTEQDLNVLEDATWVLSRYQSAATASLLTQIQHPNPRIRHNIVHALGKVTDPAAVPALISASTDPDPIVRQKSVYALGQIGDTAAIDALIVSLDDATQEVK